MTKSHNIGDRVRVVKRGPGESGGLTWGDREQDPLIAQIYTVKTVYPLPYSYNAYTLEGVPGILWLPWWLDPVTENPTEPEPEPSPGPDTRHLNLQLAARFREIAEIYRTMGAE